MKDLLILYAQYNIWANKKLFEKISKLSDEQIHAEIISSFPSLYKTALHLWHAEDIWWQRLQLVEQVHTAASDFTGTFKSLVFSLNKQSVQWEEWIQKATANQLTYVFRYHNSKLGQQKQEVCKMLIHLFNHATFHRGQMVTMLRQLGVENIPATDFHLFCATKK